MLTAKCRDTEHTVTMALIKQTWQNIKDDDHLNGLNQSCCYKTGKWQPCKEGNQSELDGLGSWLQQTDLVCGGYGEGRTGRAVLELKARTDETEKRLGIFLLLKGFSADKRTLTTAKRAFHLSCTNMEDDEWTHKSDTVGESKGGEHCREESQKT